MNSSKKRSPSGEIRQSQILSTFGPGAMVDLPNYSILIGGLNHWHGDRRRIYEDRLAGRVAEILGVKDIALYAPPVDLQDPQAPRSGISAFMFPAWFVAQVEETWTDPNRKQYRTRPLLPWASLVKGKYLNPERKGKPVVPVRFVQACVNGHISDIDWYRFVHNGQTNCRGQLWLDEGGSGNDFADIFVRCEACKARRPLSDATVPSGKVLGFCQGHRPWLGPKAQEPCISQATEKPEYNRLLVRSASNAYFSQVLSVISLPDSDEALRNAVNLVYEDFLQYAESVAEVKKERKKQKVFTALEGFSDDAVWTEIQHRQGGYADKPKSIKQVEIETLLSSPEEVGEDVPEGDFYARARKLDELSPALLKRIERIILVHRLREVVAQVGFTRFEAAMPDIDGELDINVQLAALDLETTWVPAIENKGEGVFIAFRKQAIDDWLKRKPVQERGRQLMKGFTEWQESHKLSEAKFPGLPYIMLHSLSHLLITAVSLECGYSASSIRERIYAGDAGYGILLYTGSAGSEGTLGGLVQVGKRIEYHLSVALELGRLCSNDPVCAQHKPDSVQEERFLHGSACHGCLLIAEPSCERRNEFLDRALVVATVEELGAEFFPDTDL
ncbi:DrmB family protein [Aerosakkonemataceae cyanobacterium BLCC-F50]|uniref:DrmB family protein n=1 Tax=Floridaenema flaviceps BLCC-F50 TaxID=3153642 RepID=A0ABV4XIF9_9CYAN